MCHLRQGFGQQYKQLPVLVFCAHGGAVPAGIKARIIAAAAQYCTLAAQRLEAYFPGCEVVRIPVADGGEGTVACFHEACGGTLVSVLVSGPYGEAITAEYLQLPGGQAVIEMASAAGLPQVEDRKDPCKTTTYGVGQLIRHAVEAGNQNILLGLGGSCTNDGGCGCAAAGCSKLYG